MALVSSSTRRVALRRAARRSRGSHARRPVALSPDPRGPRCPQLIRLKMSLALPPPFPSATRRPSGRSEKLKESLPSPPHYTLSFQISARGVGSTATTTSTRHLVSSLLCSSRPISSQLLAESRSDETRPASVRRERAHSAAARRWTGGRAGADRRVH